MVDLLERLLGHDQWTTARFLDLSRGLSEAQLDQPFDIGHRTLRATFAHMLDAFDFWIGVMTGQPVDGQGDETSLVALTDRYQRSYTTFAAFARRIRDEQRLDDTFPDPDDDDVRLTFGSTIVHVILHSAQHRSEALHMLERLGVPSLPEGNPLEWELQAQGN
jgi:uncharacterized damage-inducible protein DinB